MPGKILAPVDGSPSSEKALLEAVRLAKKFGWKITAVNVIEFPAWTISSPEALVTSEKMLDYQKSVLSRAAELARRHGARISTAALEGNVPEKIISFAKKGRFNLIVMGNRGLSDIDRFLLGSVSDRVVSHSPCSVLVVK